MTASTKTWAIGDCTFCNVDRPLLLESGLAVAFFDSFPVSRGHALVVPRRHVITVWELDDREYAECFQLVRELRMTLEREFSPDGFNIGVNCGEAAGQSVWHAHIHLIPRYRGDVPEPKGGVRHVIPLKGAY